MNGNPTTVVFCCHEYSELIKQQVTFNDISTNGLSISILAMLMTVFSRCSGFYPIKVHNRKKKNWIENNLHSTWVGFIYIRNRTDTPYPFMLIFFCHRTSFWWKEKLLSLKKSTPTFQPVQEAAALLSDGPLSVTILSLSWSGDLLNVEPQTVCEPRIWYLPFQ